tara:strand:- start:309 stop:485 length:177 start_codon:yes stop_codon:yes gene_type:complete
MTDKIFLIGLGGAGIAVVKDIETTNHGSFIYRCLDISNNGTVTEEITIKLGRSFSIRA